MALTDTKKAKEFVAGAPNIILKGDLRPKEDMKKASMDDPFYRQDSRNELALELFGKELRLLTPEEMDILDEEAQRLMQKFMADGGRAQYGLGSLVKSVKKAVKGVVSGVKDNPLLAAAALNFAPMLGGGQPFFGLGGLKGSVKTFGNPLSFLNLSDGVSKTDKAMDALKVGGAGAVITGLLSQKEELNTGDPDDANRRAEVIEQLKVQFSRLYPKGENESPEDYDVRITAMVDAADDSTIPVGNMAEGGRIGFGGGSDMGTVADSKGNVGPSKGGYQGGGTGPVERPGGGGNGGPSGPPEIKKSIFDKIRRNPIFRTVSPFVNPFSIGMSQIPPKVQQAMGIGSLIKNIGNFIFTPAGAAEFDMEAFQKAGAEKGFLGMNDELEAMQKYYDFAQKQKAMGKDPAAIRDSANIGSALYGIDMDLVPETFLQTEEDFTKQKSPMSFFNLGGRAGYAMGDSASENAMQAAGIEGLPVRQNPKGVKELDLRKTGGFIPPVGVKEKADDIPAMLSNNEFVFTADAVRAAGGGSVNKGAQRMYDLMKSLESKVV